MSYLTGCFKSLKPQRLYFDQLYVAQNRILTDLEAL